MSGVEEPLEIGMHVLRCWHGYQRVVVPGSEQVLGNLTSGLVGSFQPTILQLETSLIELRCCTLTQQHWY